MKVSTSKVQMTGWCRQCVDGVRACGGRFRREPPAADPGGDSAPAVYPSSRARHPRELWRI